MSFRYFPLSDGQVAERSVAWRGLTECRPFGRVALTVGGSPPDTADFARELPHAREIPLLVPDGGHPDWAAEIRAQLRHIQLNALTRYQDDFYPAISIPRRVHAQTQGLAEAFGAELIPQENEDGLFYPEPCIFTPEDVDKIEAKPLQECLFWNTVEFVRYARAATGGRLAVRNPVMTGPIDTANYLLGSMTLMEWIYDEPAALHKLLDKITDFLIRLISELQRSADGEICPDHSFCLPRGFNFCSEVRSMISAEAYEEFEAPYLLRIGQACGSFMVHSCGTWERALPATMANPHIMMAHFQCREMDLAKVCAVTGGKLSCYIGPSVNLGEMYTWPRIEDFFRHIIGGIPHPIPLEISVAAGDIERFLAVERELDGGPSGMFRWML